jgi:integral membrane sensor domain MASE1
MDHNAVVTEQAFTQPQRIPGRSYERPALRSGWAFYPVPVAFLAGAYCGAAKLGLTMALVAEPVTAVWPPTGLALAALLLLGYRAWPGITLGAFLANATANAPPGTAAGIALGNTLEALLGAWLFRRLVGFDQGLERVQDVLGLAVLAAGVSTTVGATIGATSLCWGGVRPWAAYPALWGVWWLGGARGGLVVAPLLLTWAGWRRMAWRPRRVAEAAALLPGLVAVSLLVFAGPTAQFSFHPPACTVFPFVIWAALLRAAGKNDREAGKTRPFRHSFRPLLAILTENRVSLQSPVTPGGRAGGTSRAALAPFGRGPRLTPLPGPQFRPQSRRGKPFGAAFVMREVEKAPLPSPPSVRACYRVSRGALTHRPARPRQSPPRLHPLPPQRTLHQAQELPGQEKRRRGAASPPETPGGRGRCFLPFEALRKGSRPCGFTSPPDNTPATTWTWSGWRTSSSWPWSRSAATSRPGTS